MLASGGASAGAGAGASGGGGGVTYVAKPEIQKVSCLRRCASRRRARPGSTLKIVGESLGSVTGVVFLGSYGRGDDIQIRVRSNSDSRLHARVPMGAVSGPVAAVSRSSASSSPSRPVAILPPPPPEPNTELSPVAGPRDSGAPAIETGTSRTKAFIGARRAVTFSYRVAAGSAVSLTVELIQASDGTAVRSWTRPPTAPGDVQSVSWNGRLGRAGARPGRYSFRLTAAGPDGAVARSSQDGDFERDAFDLYDHVFPVRGRHDYGGAGSRFGTGRAGHSHQGHDVFARCGTRMLAARGGRVQYSGYHAAAGNYLVIDGAGTELDYAYMHLAEPSPFRAGDRVFTGQRIGAVGETGNARGCHLHFELWDRPGWYEGGRPFDPLPSLRVWDSWS